MFSFLRNRFGIPGILAVVALVFAMGGGAYAALSGKEKKEVKNIAKKCCAGKPGKEGPAGPQGPAGAKGDKGDTGAQGSAGAKGATGATGPAGTAGSTGATGKTGPTGATGVTGSAGPTGPTGSPWTAGGVLPVGATETGSWFTTTDTEEPVEGFFLGKAVISFPIPLSPAFNTGQFTIVKKSEAVPAECDDGAAPAAGPEHPEADSGRICIFVAEGALLVGIINKSGGIAGTPNASTAGAILTPITGVEEEVWGTFAVTG